MTGCLGILKSISPLPSMSMPCSGHARSSSARPNSEYGRSTVPKAVATLAKTSRPAKIMKIVKARAPCDEGDRSP
eukprot:6178720-Pleurochrysis_carterae.AAC.2